MMMASRKAKKSWKVRSEHEAMEFFVFKWKTWAAPTALSTSELFVDRLAVNYILINTRVRQRQRESDSQAPTNEKVNK